MLVLSFIFLFSLFFYPAFCFVHTYVVKLGVDGPIRVILCLFVLSVAIIYLHSYLSLSHRLISHLHDCAESDLTQRCIRPLLPPLLSSQRSTPSTVSSTVFISPHSPSSQGPRSRPRRGGMSFIMMWCRGIGSVGRFRRCTISMVGWPLSNGIHLLLPLLFMMGKREDDDDTGFTDESLRADY